MFSNFSRVLRNQEEHPTLAHLLIVFMGAHKYYKLESIFKLPYSNPEFFVEFVAYMFSCDPSMDQRAYKWKSANILNEMEHACLAHLVIVFMGAREYY